MAQPAIGIRFNPGARDYIAREAQELGVSFAEFVRASALIGAVIHATSRGAPVEQAWPELLEIALRLDDVRGGPPE